MCLAANVPLIESGTTGFNGQVQVIMKVGETLEIALVAGTEMERDAGHNRMLRLHE